MLGLTKLPHNFNNIQTHNNHNNKARVVLNCPVVALFLGVVGKDPDPLPVKDSSTRASLSFISVELELPLEEEPRIARSRSL